MKLIDWGLIDYQDAERRQLELVNAVVKGDHGDAIIFCTHPALVTVGRRTPPSEYAGWTGPVFQTARGGRATYHGPSQLIIYPVVHLQRRRSPLGLKTYLRTLELIVTQVIKFWGIEATPPQVAEHFTQPRTGVWVNNRKLAAIGIAVRKWVTYHGVAINVDEDARAFSGISPCGYSPGMTTSMQAIVGKTIDRAQLKAQLSVACQELLL